MADLSPAAQAVKDAFDSKWAGTRHQALIAALRAAADQGENFYDPHEGKVSVVRAEHLLAIAAELEGANG